MKEPVVLSPKDGSIIPLKGKDTVDQDEIISLYPEYNKKITEEIAKFSGGRFIFLGKQEVHKKICRKKVLLPAKGFLRLVLAGKPPFPRKTSAIWIVTKEFIETYYYDTSLNSSSRAVKRMEEGWEGTVIFALSSDKLTVTSHIFSNPLPRRIIRNSRVFRKQRRRFTVLSVLLMTLLGLYAVKLLGNPVDNMDVSPNRVKENLHNYLSAEERLRKSSVTITKKPIMETSIHPGKILLILENSISTGNWISDLTIYPERFSLSLKSLNPETAIAAIKERIPDTSVSYNRNGNGYSVKVEGIFTETLLSEASAKPYKKVFSLKELILESGLLINNFQSNGLEKSIICEGSINKGQDFLSALNGRTCSFKIDSIKINPQSEGRLSLAITFREFLEELNQFILEGKESEDFSLLKRFYIPVTPADSYPQPRDNEAITESEKKTAEIIGSFIDVEGNHYSLIKSGNPSGIVFKRKEVLND